VLHVPWWLHASFFAAILLCTLGICFALFTQRASVANDRLSELGWHGSVLIQHHLE
jgi:hypothetical protein